MTNWALALHGGAYNDVREGPAEKQEPFLRTLLAQQAEALAAGASALDVVTATVAAMEDSGWFNAGKGAVATANGHVELDAGIMDGATLRAGAIASVRGVKNPILGARAVMERTPHVLLVGAGAETFLREQKLEEVPSDYHIHAHSAPKHASSAGGDTIGCVARDVHGRLAVATSTGGLAGKRAGRVGDSPVIGAGTWADARVAISCTGTGEFFIRTAAASRLAMLVEYHTTPLADAASTVIHQHVGPLGGSGGLIAVDGAGNIAMPFNSKGMVRGSATPRGIEVTV